MPRKSESVANFEFVLITRILETGDLRTAVKRKITADFFFLPEARSAYAMLQRHFQKYGKTPSIPLFKESFPSFTFASTSDPVAAICDQIRSHKLYADLGKVLEEGARLTREDPQEALDHFRQGISRLTTSHLVTRDIDATKTMHEAKEEYSRAKEMSGLLGIPWPWPKLNESTLGIQKSELIFFYARPGSLKTWMLTCAAVHAHRSVEGGLRVLLVTNEMPTEQIRRRVHAAYAQVDYKALRRGKLTASEERRYYDDLEAFSEMKEPFVISGNDDAAARGGVVSLAAKIDEVDPDIVFIDGVYLMGDDRTNRQTSDWGSVAHLTQDLKHLAKQKDVPIVGSTQSNRSGEKTKGSTLNELAYGDSFGQDGDYLIRIIYDKPQKENNEAIMTTPKVREDEGCTFTVNAFVAKNFTQKFAMDSQEEAEELLATTDEGIMR